MKPLELPTHNEFSPICPVSWFSQLSQVCCPKSCLSSGAATSLVTLEGCEDTALSIQVSTSMKGYPRSRWFGDHFHWDWFTPSPLSNSLHLFLKESGPRALPNKTPALLITISESFPCNSSWDICTIRWKCRDTGKYYWNTYWATFTKLVYKWLLLCIVFKYCTIFIFCFLIMNTYTLIPFYFVTFFFWFTQWNIFEFIVFMLCR